MKSVSYVTLAAVCGSAGSLLAAPTLGPTGNYYEAISAANISWADANTAAGALIYNGKSGHLVTITGAAEDAFVLDLVYAWQSANLGDPTELWAGGFQDPAGVTDPQAGWTWVNGEGAFPGDNLGPTYANWAGGEPNDTGGSGMEQYLGLGLQGYISPPTWNDEGNLSLIGGYVVEYECVPDQGVSLLFSGMTFAALAFSRRLIRR
jgi:hypothetical protein